MVVGDQWSEMDPFLLINLDPIEAGNAGDVDQGFHLRSETWLGDTPRAHTVHGTRCAQRVLTFDLGLDRTAALTAMSLCIPGQRLRQA